MLRTAHPRAAAAVAALDWGWDRSDGGCLELDLRAPARSIAAAAHLGAALPRAACRVVIAFSPHYIDFATPGAARAVVRALPRTLRVIDVHTGMRVHDLTLCTELLDHLRELRELDLGDQALSAAALARAPPQLRRLRAAFLPRADGGPRFAHLSGLITLWVAYSFFDDAALAALPHGLVRLQAAHTQLTRNARFAHLTRLRALDVSGTFIGNAALASTPPTLRWLNAFSTFIDAGARFDHLARLRYLDVRNTRAGAAAVASVPRSVTRLHTTHGTATDGVHAFIVVPPN